MNYNLDVKLLEKKYVGDNRVTLYFSVPKGFEWEAGSHISLALKGYNKNDVFNKEYVRKFSINTLMEENKIGITTRIDSSDSLYKKKIDEIKVGDRCSIIDYGVRLPIRREDKGIVFISMGVGMSTVRPLIKRIIENSEGIKSLKNICVNKTENYLFKSELENYVFCDNECCHNRKDLKNIIDTIKDIKNNIFYIIGSRDFVQDMVVILKEHGVSKNDIMIDKKEGILEGLYSGMSYMDIKNKVREKNKGNSGNKDLFAKCL